MGKGASGKKKSNNSALIWVAATAIAVVALIIGVNFAASGSKGSATSGPKGSAKSDAERGAVGNKMGPDSAKVKVVEFGDFQ